MRFRHTKFVAFHDTDAMGVAHHGSYIHFFEEARVDWLRELGLMAIHIPQGPYIFAVADLNCQYLKPALFDDKLEIFVECRVDGARLEFRYAIWLERIEAYVATGVTRLVPMGRDLRVRRLPADAREKLASLPWSEQWPPEARVVNE